MIPVLTVSTCVFFIAFVVALILWLARRKKIRTLQKQLVDEKARCKKASEEMHSAQMACRREATMRKDCENKLNQSTAKIVDMQNTIDKYRNTAIGLNTENEALKQEKTALSEDLNKVKLIASKMKKYIYQCRNKIEYLSDQEIQRNKSTRTVTFWSQSLGKMAFDYADLTNYVTDKMQVLGGDVPAEEKFKRLQKAFDENMVIEQCDMTAAAKIKGASGEIYETTLHSCTCEDFVKGHYKTPCKHMYRLAIELGLVSIYDRSIYESMRYDFQKLREQRAALIQKEKNLKARENRLKKKQAEQKAKGADKKL